MGNTAIIQQLSWMEVRRDELIAGGRAEKHHIYPESGWVSVYLRSEADVHNAVEIMRAKYEQMNIGRSSV